MTTQHTPYLLKVLSGSNAGALVRLRVGEIVIGKSMSSDIILHDENIADLHVKLKVKDESMVLEALAKPVFVDNKPLDADECVLKPYQVVTLGSIDFFIADARKPGRRNSQGIDASQEPPVITAVAGHTGRSQKEGRLDGKQGVRTTHLSSRPSVPGAGGGKWFWLGLGVLLLANFLYFLPNLLSLAEQMGLKESSQQRAESVLDRLDSEGLVLSKGTDGRASITGYVNSRDERRELINKFNRAGSDINYRIWVREDLVMNAGRVARALGQPDLRFSNLEEGKLAANGYVSSDEDWAQIKNNIMSDVSGIQAISDTDVQTLLKRKEALVQFIEKKGLSSRVKVTIEQGRIKIDGELTQGELSRWADLYQEFVALNGDGPAVIENLYDARDRIKLVIRSVSVGETPFLVSKDGRKYMEGSNLGNSYFIKKITPDHVLLSNNGIEIPIYYGVEDQ